ncbi:hypothetical protein [Fontivita pretiosa]|uniref:hypothetical protein n=1 Tax=Fontivita pretiosa TaxID=2989684 RepID=UPI003D17EF7E
MAAEDIPQNVVSFLAEHIDSVVQLEALLLLHANPQQPKPAADVARELRIDPNWTEAALTKLAQSGLLESAAAGYRYAPRSPELDQTIAALAREYQTRRVTIISMIFSKPPDPIRQFADAFRLRKDDRTDRPGEEPR